MVYCLGQLSGAEREITEIVEYIRRATVERGTGTLPGVPLRLRGCTMNRAHAIALVMLLSACTACAAAEARDQWLLTISTDAPIPALGDRLLVEILDAGGELACSACRRHFDATSLSALPLSFGAAADPSFHSVRARLHRSAVGHGRVPPAPVRRPLRAARPRTLQAPTLRMLVARVPARQRATGRRPRRSRRLRNRRRSAHSPRRRALRAAG